MNDKDRARMGREERTSRKLADLILARRMAEAEALALDIKRRQEERKQGRG